MKRYVVYEPRNGVPRTAKGAEKLVFVREGFSWAAFLFPPLWLLFRRAWFGLLVWLVLTGLTVVAMVYGVTGFDAFLLMLLVSLVIGFEAPWFRSLSLRRRRWRPIAIVTGSSQIEAERTFFAGWDIEAEQAPGAAEPRSAPPRYGASSGVLGLFPEPETGR